MLLRIILSKDDIRKIQIESLPETLDEFYSFLESKLGLEGDFVVQYEDREFDNELCNLMSLSDLPEGKATLKITVKQASESYHTDSTLDTASLSSSASSLSSPTSPASEGIGRGLMHLRFLDFVMMLSCSLKGVMKPTKRMEPCLI